MVREMERQQGLEIPLGSLRAGRKPDSSPVLETALTVWAFTVPQRHFSVNSDPSIAGVPGSLRTSS